MMLLRPNVTALAAFQVLTSFAAAFRCSEGGTSTLRPTFAICRSLRMVHSRRTLVTTSTASAVATAVATAAATTTAISQTVRSCLRDGGANGRVVDDADSVTDIHMRYVPAFGRRTFLITQCAIVASLAVPLPALESLTGNLVAPASAAYGEGTNIALPNYIDYLIEKNAVTNTSAFLYQGADREVQLGRISAATSRLSTIPAIAESRKWSQVDGVLTGPLGTLLQTMNQILANSGGTNVDATQAAAKVKANLLAIGQASKQKDTEKCIVSSKAAILSLETFAKAAFCDTTSRSETSKDECQ